MSAYKYKFSVIMPIHNVEAYIREAIDSVINQTIGFEDSIQLILVNDGSTDRCEEICLEYKGRYQDNIIYIKQENQGVSHARNAGMAYVKGKYVNFFDADDKWNTDVFQKVWNFFEGYGDKIDVACCKSTYFEAKTGEHNLNNKFKGGDRVIDIRENPKFILLNVTTAFIKADVINEETFDERISIGEDSKYITKIILRKEKYGVLGSVEYNIRKRHENSSLTQNRNIGRYTLTMEHYYKHMLEYSLEKYGEVIPYIQHVVINGLKYRALETRRDFMTEEEWRDYTESVTELIKKIDDQVIAETNNLKMMTRLYIFKVKHGRDIEPELYIKNNKVYFNKVSLGKIPRNPVKIDEITVSWKNMTVSGTITAPLNDNIKLYIKDKKGYQEAVISADEEQNKETFIGETFPRGRKFVVTAKKKEADPILVLGCRGEYYELPV